MCRIILLIFFWLNQLVWAGVNFPTGTSANAILTCGTNNDILTGVSAESVSIWAYSTADHVSASSGVRLITKETPGDVELLVLPTKAIEWANFSITPQLLIVSSNNSIPLGTLYHIVLVGDGSNTATNYHIYVNNSELTYATQQNGSGSVSTSGAVANIGNRAAKDRPFSGYIYEVAIWANKLTSADRTYLYNSGKPGRNVSLVSIGAPKRWYRLVECPQGLTCNSTTFVDSGSSSVNCTASNAPLGQASVYSFLKNVNKLYKATIY